MTRAGIGSWSAASLRFRPGRPDFPVRATPPVPSRPRPLSLPSRFPSSSLLGLACALLFLSGLSGCGDDVTCIFTTGCQGGGTGGLGENEASLPVDGQWIVDGKPALTDLFPSGTQNPAGTPVVLVFSESIQPESLEGAIEIVVEDDIVVFAVAQDFLAGLLHAALDLLRQVHAYAGGRRIAVTGIDAALPAGEGRVDLVRGDPARAMRALREGAALVSEPLALKEALAIGGTLAVRGPRGEVSFPVAGVYRDYGSEAGAALVDRAAFARAFGDGPPHRD